jgi:hypothetical protein
LAVGVPYDDPFTFDPHDVVPGDLCVRVVTADAEMCKPGRVPDAQPRNPQCRRGELTTEVVAAAERAAGFSDDLAAKQ